MGSLNVTPLRGEQEVGAKSSTDGRGRTKPKFTYENGVGTPPVRVWSGRCEGVIVLPGNMHKKQHLDAANH